jgi:hypothetical protein
MRGLHTVLGLQTSGIAGSWIPREVSSLVPSIVLTTRTNASWVTIPSCAPEKVSKGCIESALTHAQTGTMTEFQVVHDGVYVKVDCRDPRMNATLTCASSIMAWSRPSASSLASMPSSRAVVTKSLTDNLPSSSASNWSKPARGVMALYCSTAATWVEGRGIGV